METTYEGYSHKDLIKLLGKQDAEWFIKGCPIPFRSDYSEWQRHIDVYAKIAKAKLKVHKSDVNYTPPKIYLKSDDLGIKGVFNPADGKKYDSRSAYEAAVKAKGLVIMGDDAPTKPSTPKTQTVNWEEAVAETLKTKPLKGKK